MHTVFNLLRWIPLNVNALGPNPFVHIKRPPVLTEINNRKKNVL